MDKTDTQRLGLPNLGLGIGLRSKHYAHLMKNDPVVDWFEIISENYMNNFGYARHVLEHVAGVRPVVMHGVSMSIGSTDPLNLQYLQQRFGYPTIYAGRVLRISIRTICCRCHLRWKVYNMLLNALAGYRIFYSGR